MYLLFRKKFYAKLSCYAKLDNKGKNRFREDVYNEGAILAAACYYDYKVKSKLFKSFIIYVKKSNSQ